MFSRTTQDLESNCDLLSHDSNLERGCHCRVTALAESWGARQYGPVRGDIRTLRARLEWRHKINCRFARACGTLSPFGVILYSRCIW